MGGIDDQANVRGHDGTGENGESVSGDDLTKRGETDRGRGVVKPDRASGLVTKS